MELSVWSIDEEGNKVRKHYQVPLGGKTVKYMEPIEDTKIILGFESGEFDLLEVG